MSIERKDGGDTVLLNNHCLLKYLFTFFMIGLKYLAKATINEK
jgi:hypothetical protein